MASFVTRAEDIKEFSNCDSNWMGRSYSSRWTPLQTGKWRFEDDPWSIRSWVDRNLGGYDEEYRIPDSARSPQHHEGKGVRTSNVLIRYRAVKRSIKYTGRLRGQRKIFLYQTF